jgi:hypothetical protein
MDRTHAVPNSRSRVFVLDGSQSAEFSTSDFRMSVDYAGASEITATVKCSGASRGMATCTFEVESFLRALQQSVSDLRFLEVTYDKAVTGVMSRIGHPTDLSRGPSISKARTMENIERAKKKLAAIERYRRLLHDLDNTLAAKVEEFKSTRFNARYKVIERD